MAEDCRVKVHKGAQKILLPIKMQVHWLPCTLVPTDQWTWPCWTRVKGGGQTFSNNQKANRESVRTKCRLRAAAASECRCHTVGRSVGLYESVNTGYCDKRSLTVLFQQWALQCALEVCFIEMKWQKKAEYCGNKFDNLFNVGKLVLAGAHDSNRRLLFFHCSTSITQELSPNKVCAIVQKSYLIYWQ